MRKPIVLLAMLPLALTFASVAPVQAQEDGWDGGDDLPTNPLPCGDEEAAPAEGEAPEYDGGQPTDPPDMAGQPITLVDIPKLIGIGYFNATAEGMQEAAAELGNVEVINDGPTSANIDEQITFIDNYITQGVDGVLFAANDPVAIGPVLTKALEEGIHVVGYDANSVPEAREWFVNQAEFNGIAKAMIDSLVAEQGEEASFGIVTSTFTTPNQARWIAEMEAYAERVLSGLDLARDARGPRGRPAVVQPVADPAQQVRRRHQRHLRHDQRGDAGCSRRGHPGRRLRDRLGGRPGHAEPDEAVRRGRLRAVRRAVEPDRPRLRGGLRHACRRRR